MTTNGQQRREGRTLEQELHNLAQPLMTLQCCLEIGRMARQPSVVRRALEDGLRELERVVEGVRRVREAASNSGTPFEKSLRCELSALL